RLRDAGAPAGRRPRRARAGSDATHDRRALPLRLGVLGEQPDLRVPADRATRTAEADGARRRRHAAVADPPVSASAPGALTRRVHSRRASARSRLLTGAGSGASCALASATQRAPAAATPSTPIAATPGTVVQSKSNGRARSRKCVNA